MHGSLELGIVAVPVGVAGGFLVEVPLKSFAQVYAGLVGKGCQNPQYIGHFIAEVPVGIGGLFALVSIAPGHDAGQFTHFFREDRHVGQFAEIPNANGGDPLVHGGLYGCEGG